MIKIGLITIHATDNYGAVLQAFATQQTLEKYGEVKIINYNTPYVLKTMCVIRTGSTFRHLLRMAKDLFRFFSRIKAINKFSEFILYKLHLTRVISSHEDFSKLENEFDVFFSGSDQIWRPGIVSEKTEFEPAYFLDFVKNKIKISYGSSTGGYEFSKEEERVVANYLKSYDYVSVRELDTSEKMTHLLGVSVKHVLDPTLLLTRDVWLKSLKIDTDNKQGDYILVYALKKDLLMRSTVKLISRRLNLKIIAIDQDPFLGFNTHKHIKDAGPEEFVELFSNACFVVTSSFHGVAFSLNFNIPFVAIKPVVGSNRIKSLLGAVGLLDRYVDDMESAELIDYSQRDIFHAANSKLEHLRGESINFIKISLTRLLN